MGLFYFVFSPRKNRSSRGSLPTVMQISTQVDIFDNDFLSAQERKSPRRQAKRKKHSISRIKLTQKLTQTTTHIPILSSNFVTPYTHTHTGNTHRAHMGDIKEKEIKFGPIVDHLKDDPAAGGKNIFRIQKGRTQWVILK